MNDYDYDELNRLTSQEDSQANTVLYEYDSMSRVTKIVPAQGTNYRIQYTFKKNGAVETVAAYEAGSAETTTYVYNTTSGKLTTRTMPLFSGKNVVTDYAYDGGGRLDTETVKHVTTPGGAVKNLYQTIYTRSWLTYGNEVLAETKKRNTGDTAWDNDEKTEYEYTPMGWQKFEGRSQYSGSWAVVYDTTQVYDKNGNRTGYDKNVALGQTANFGRSENLTYTFDNNNRPTGISDADDASYDCDITCDANGNITQIDEKGMSGMSVQSTLTQEFQYDWASRMTSYKTTRYDAMAAKSKFVRRQHAYDATGRLVRSVLKNWETGQMEPGGSALEHTYAGSLPLQNYDGSSTYGAVWVHAGAAHEYGPLKSPAPDTSSQKDYNTGTRWQPNRRSFQAATAATEGDKRLLYGQGRAMTKDASGTGSTWSTGTVSQPTGFGVVSVESRLEFQGTVTATDMSRATDMREKDRTGVFGNTFSYAGSYSRVTSEALGRDLNPLGRGDGMAYVGGWVNLGSINPSLPGTRSKAGQGSSVNNSCHSCNSKASNTAYYNWVDSETQPCNPDPNGAYGTWMAADPNACCGFGCECGCSNVDPVRCCYHVDPRKFTTCPISSASPNVTVSSLAKTKEHRAFYAFGGKQFGLTPRPIPSPKSYLGPGIPKPFASMDLGAPEHDLINNLLKFACETFIQNPNCVPRDLQPCAANICNSKPHERVKIVFDCPAEFFEGGYLVNPAKTECSSSSATITICLKGILNAPKTDAEKIQMLQNTIVHEMLHAMLCCASGNGLGCWGKSSEYVVDACTENCLAGNFLETSYTKARRANPECNCDPDPAGRLCFTEKAHACAGGFDSQRCQHSTNVHTQPVF